MQPDAKVVDRWNNCAPAWEKHRETIRQMFAPVTDALIDAAGIEQGQTILDVATGPGEPALTIARVVGRKGKVYGVDMVAGMVEAAGRHAEQQGIENAKFEVGTADKLPFPDETFDAVVCRFGIMFFPSPVDGVREMLRVLKPARKVVFAVWNFEDRNPFSGVLSKAVASVVDWPASPPDAPEGTRCAPEGKLRRILDEAGAANTSEQLLQFRIEVPLKAEEFLDLRCEMNEKVRKLSADQLASAKRIALPEYGTYETARGMSMPSEIRIVAGVRPL